MPLPEGLPSLPEEHILQFLKDLDPRADEAVGIRQMKAMREASKRGESLNFAPLNILRAAVRGGILCALVELGLEKLAPGHGIPLGTAFGIGTAMDLIQSTLRGAQAAVKEAKRGGFKD